MKDWKEELTKTIRKARWGYEWEPGLAIEDMQEFIQYLLDQQKQDLIKKLEGEKLLGIAKYGNMPAPHDTTYKRGHNQAVDRAIEIIEEMK